MDGATPAPLGADTLGNACTGACGAEDDRLCSTQSEACTLCLVDPTSTQIAYCTQDCTSVPCPAGWTCDAIKAFGQPQVEKACVAQPAVCGDGAVQLGEACDGDVPQLGRCVDCARFEAICGDGFVQPPETCDGPRDGQYCIGCASLEPPRVVVMVRELVVNGVERQEGNSTWYYGLGADAGSYTLALPTAGDAASCDGIEVLESTTERTRFAWSLCSDWGISTWQLVMPRATARHQDTDGSIPAEVGVSVRVRSRDGSYHLTWDMSHVFRFDLNVYSTEAPAWSQGNLQFTLEQTDPLQTFSDARATADLNLRILHPMP